MLHTFWNRITRCNLFAAGKVLKGDEDPGPTLAEVQALLSEEFRGLRKILRKQALVVEELRARSGEAAKPQRQDRAGEGLMQMASTFFHLDQSLRDQALSSPQRREAVFLFWLQLEQLLDREDIQMIREQGVPFDPRLHRAVLAHESGARQLVVTEVLEAGFIEGGKVRKPAKVILGPATNEQEIREEKML
ncbi:MAG: nucleotide exchange factor GrpE [Desulfobulbaceae bacterium]|nr:nucleotide exchange factor GrpE [Desulfobulbaceae bacterium]